MTDNKVINAGLYIRVSTERQVKEGYSVAAQKENLGSFSKQQGWNIYDIYADEGISGKNIQDRPEVKRLIEDIKQGNIDVVVLYKFDRLTRDSRDTEDIISLVQECGIQVFTLSGGVVDVSTATGRFSVRISGAVAQLEREQTIERVKVAFKQKVSEGYTLASQTTCYGYNRKKHEKEQTINQEEAKVIRRIFRMYNNGSSFTEIANILNAEKVPTKMKGKKLKKAHSDEYREVKSVWMPKTIRLILTNPTYIGKVRYHIGKSDYFEADGLHKPIITEKIWNKAQERISKIKHVSRTNKPKDDVYYCGTLVCGICGQKLTTNRTKKTRKDGTWYYSNGYRCVNREKKLCTCLGVSHRKVEEAFLEYIDNIDELTELDNINIVDDETQALQEELDSLNNALQQTNIKRKEVMDLFMLNEITHEQLKYMTKELEKKQETLTSEVDKIASALAPRKTIDKSDIAKTIREHWEFLSERERLDFVTNFIEEIVIVNRDKDRHNGKPEILSVKFYEE